MKIGSVNFPSFIAYKNDECFMELFKEKFTQFSIVKTVSEI